MCKLWYDLETRQYVNGVIKYLKLDETKFQKASILDDGQETKKKPKFGVNNYHKRTPKNVQVVTQKNIVNVYQDVRSIGAKGANV